MCLSEVNDVDIVADACAVVSGIVVSENMKFFELTDSCLAYVRKEVVRDTLGVLTDKSRLVCSDGVEITEDRNALKLTCVADVLEHSFDNKLGLAIGVCSGKREIFADRNGLGRAVHGCGGRENDRANAVLDHSAEKVEGCVKIVAIIAKGLSAGLADSLKSRKVDDRVNLVFCKYFASCLEIKKVAGIELGTFARDLFNSVKNLGLAV